MKKPYIKHTVWIIGIALGMIILDFYFGDDLSRNDVIRHFVVACFIEFANYCQDVYRKDNEVVKQE